MIRDGSQWNYQNSTSANANEERQADEKPCITISEHFALCYALVNLHINIDICSNAGNYKYANY